MRRVVPVLIAAALAGACQRPPDPAEASAYVASWRCGQFPDSGPVLVAPRGELAGWRFRCNGGQASALEPAQLPACDSNPARVVWFHRFLRDGRLQLRTFSLEVPPCGLQGAEASRYAGDFTPYALDAEGTFDELSYVAEKGKWLFAGSERGRLRP